jgi:hypothetical protein
MGIRLYPNTKDAAALEQLAGVPKGTMALLQLWEEMEKTYRASKGLGPYDDEDEHGNDIGYAMYCLVKDHPVMDLQDFLLFGWGKFSCPVPAGHEEETGCLPSGPEAAALLRATRFEGNARETVELAGGVYWG